MRRHLLTSTTALALLLVAGQAYAGMDEAKAFLDAEIGDIYSVRDTRFGQIVRADIRIDYRNGSRHSPVTCEVEDGMLVSARSDY